MARPQAEAKLGFYPFPAECVPLLLRHIKIPAYPATTTILDPCAGKGAAVAGIAAGLGIPDENVHCVELSQSRSEELHEKFPKFPILGPASFMGAQISYNAFSVAYLNPPYDAEMGGGRREELTFLVRTLNLLAPDGLLAFVLPEDQVLGYGQSQTAMRRTLACRLAHVEIYRLPDENRNHGEVVVFGTRRRQALTEPEGILKGYYFGEISSNLKTLGSPNVVFDVPPGRTPKIFQKIDFAPEEIRQRLARSPLARHLEPPQAAPRPSPPLPPGKGHVALILASGDLDGLVCPEGEPPHVVRGLARKIKFRDQAKCEHKTNSDGSTSDKEVFSERIELVIRAIDPSGIIRTFDNTPAAEGTSHVPRDEDGLPLAPKA